MKLSLIVFLFWCCACFSYGQVDPEIGYIVTDSGDTIHGSIFPDAKIERLNAVRFKADNSNEIVIYTPDNTSSYFYSDGNYYESFSIGDTRLFMKCLIKGFYSLYSYSAEKFKSVFYLKTNKDLLMILENTYAQIESDGKTYNRSKHEYISSLKMVMRDSPQVQKIKNC